MTWTDERMDDLANRMHAGFARADKDNRDLRAEMSAGFARVYHDIRDLRVEVKSVRDELKGDIADLRAEVKHDIAGLQASLMRFGIALLVGMVGVIATLMGAIATGAVSA